MTIGLPSYAEDVRLRHSFAGKMSFELTGNSQRNTYTSNGSSVCENVGNSSNTLSLPVNSTVEAAFLYWSGSGNIDSSVIFENTVVTASNFDIHTQSVGTQTFYSAKADVTSLVSNSNRNYSVSDLTFNTSSTYCTGGRSYGGWALAIIYRNDAEPLRVINIFDGFKNFWGQSFDLTPNNFVIARNQANLRGKHAHITWEGDNGNSGSKNTLNESLQFNGTGTNSTSGFKDLTGTGNPTSNQFNSYSNTIPGFTDGVDIDEYEIGSFLTPGATSVITRYSSGQDRVFLSAELISIPNEPVAELSLQQSGPDNIIRGQENTFDFTVTNNGPSIAPQNTQFSFTIPQGFSYVDTPHPFWSCSVNSSDLTCQYSNTISVANSSTALSLSFIVDKTAGINDSINLSGTINGLLFDNILSNNTVVKSYIINNPDLTTSIKEVIDLNGGNVNSGDTLRYTITINESAGIAVNGISITDNIFSEFSGYNIISIPLDAIDNSLLAPAGTFNSGVVQIDNINVAANGSQSIVIDAILSTNLPPSTEINNNVSITSSATTELTRSSPIIYTAQAINPATGNKLLYLHSISNVGRPNQIMRRSRPTITSHRNIGRNNKDAIWTLTPEFQSQFEFDGNSINLNLCLQSNQNNSKTHSMKIQLLHNTSVIADSSPITLTIPSKNSPVEQFSYNIPLTQSPTIPAGDTLKLRIVNLTGEGGIRVYSLDGADYCYVSIPAKTVINVDSISAINNATGLSVNEINSGSEISIQTVVSDPFGSFDITAAELSATDSQGNNVLSNLPMTVISDSGTSTKTFSLSYTIPSNIPSGYWKFSVRAKEGVENTIDHSSDFMLLVNQTLPDIKLEKSIEVFSDPIHGINSINNFSKALPGSILTYTIKAENTGLGVAENNSIWISDAIPDKTYMLVKDFNDISGQGPLIEQPINPTSGLSYQFITLDSNSDDIEFSDNNGDDFNYSPTADSEGIDKKITHFRVNPNGIFQAPVAGKSANQFSLKFRVQLQ